LTPIPKQAAYSNSRIKKDPWFRLNYVPIRAREEEEVNLDDIRAVFDGIEGSYVAENVERNDEGPLMMNAFEMITLSQGLNLSALFDRRQVVPDFLLLVIEISISNKRMSVASILQTARFDCLMMLCS
jgi:hypothetical protein